jgi:thiamine-phosphate pyrophosphorylase
VRAALPPLHAIMDVDLAAAAGWAPLDLVRAYLDGGARTLQIRAKHLLSGELLALCDAAVAIAAPYGAGIVVNDRPDVARLSGAAGVHVGQDDLAAADARLVLGSDAILGLSTHSLAQVGAALGEPVTYVAVGPVFSTSTKDTGYTAVGVSFVAEAVRLAGDVPVVAIGGITLDRAPQVWEAGAAAVAVIGDLLAGGTPAARVASYNRVAGAHRNHSAGHRGAG